MDLLLSISLKGTIIILGALGGLRPLRHRSAATRHWVLAVALIAAAVVPLIQLAVPPIRLGITPAPVVAPRQIQAPRPATAPMTPSVRRGDWDGPMPLSPAAVHTPIRLADLFIGIWLAGVALGVAVLAAGLVRLRWLTRGARVVVKGPWADVAGEIAHAYGIGRRVRLLDSHHPSLLVTWGWLRPRIVLPAGAREWHADRIRVVLAHELAHVKRADWAVQLAAETFKAICWFNPLVWIACRRLRQESERACDDAVLRRGIEGAEYAWQLLQLARAFRRQPAVWCPAPAIARRSSLEQRIGAMLDPRINRRPVTRVAGTAIVTAAAAITLLVASLSAQGRVAWIRGTVTNSNGEPVTNAVVYVTAVPADLQLRLTTDVQGKFDSGPLLPGKYKFTSETTGIGWFDLDLVAGEQIQRDFVVRVPEIDGSITVTDRQRFDRAPRDMGEPFPNVPITPQELQDFHAWRGSQPYQMPIQVRMPMPIYPADMKAQRRDGSVVVMGSIGTEGFLLMPIAEGPAPFAAAALAAVREWEWQPARLNGELVEVRFTMTVNFEIEQ